MSIKKIIFKIDKLLLGGFILRNYISYRANKSIAFKKEVFNYGFDVQYKKYDESLLNNLCDTYGSDKGEISPNSNPYAWASHNYADFFSLIFGLGRNNVTKVIECGLGTNNPKLASSMGMDGKPGASLRMWRDYFPNASVIGCDIDIDVLFSEERIKTFHCDQTSSNSIKDFLKNSELSENSVDVIIDDGLHKFFAGKCFFENMITTLRQDGIYIIEDVSHIDVIKYKEYFLKHDDDFDVKFVYFKSPLRKFGDDNNLICVTRKTID